MKKVIETILVLISLMTLLVGCKSTDESKNNVTENIEQSLSDKYFPTLVEIYFVDSSNGDIYISDDSDRFELLN